MMGFFVFLFVPLVVFVAVVLPLWLVFHYVTKWKQMQRATPEEGTVAVPKEELAQLRETARKLGERMTALERILAADSPNWRSK